MKTLLLSLSILLASGLLEAQNFEKKIVCGKITYEEKVRLQIKLAGDENAFADQLPKERKSLKILTFTEDATIFEASPGNLQDDMASSKNEGAINVRMVISGENKTYTDLKNKTILDQRDFMNRMFLVERPLPSEEWKMTGNEKNIAGYNCLEATKQDIKGIITIAWFTPAINISGGPAGICNLPGMVLEASIDNGSRTYTAISIETPEKLKIQKPSEGKKLSEEEYKKMVEEKMKEMGMEQNPEGGDQMKIYIRHQ